jgi:2-polyprenyl-3-methyl-5-hydroxy-6-metoxy-1,4-benzoquinol methylase
LLFVLLIVLGFGSCVSDHSPPSHKNSRAPEMGQGKSKGFDEMSSGYYESGARVIWQRPELVLNILGDLSTKTIADVGAGTGYFSFRLAAEGATVIGIDIDPRAIAFMNAEKERYPDEVQKRFSTRLSKPGSAMLKTKEVDVVLMVNTYIYLDDRIGYITDLISGMKAGGQLIIIDFKKKETAIGPALEDRLSLVEIQLELSRAGYNILSIDENALDYQYLVRAIRP